MQIPPYLKKGDSIGIVCPAGYMPLQNAATCIKVLQKHGYNVVVGKTLGNQFHYFSGTDEERLTDLQAMLDNPNIKAVLCGRGGYGLSRIIDNIDFKAFKKNPKWIIGFSDITVLHAHINKKLNIATLHSPMAAAFNNGGHKNKYTKSLLLALQGKQAPYQCKPHKFNNKGTATAQLVGGNLSIITHLIGSASAYITKNKILFLEDVGEYLYNIDRMMIQLQRAGLLQHLAGLIIGGFTDLKDTTTPFGQDVYSIIHKHTCQYSYPVCFNFPVGHQPQNLALKVGVNYQLMVSASKVELKEK